MLTRLRSTRGAIDLASIMVGVIVLGVLTGIAAAAVFTVIPWAQDNAAAQNLGTVTTAESVFAVRTADTGSAQFADTTGLTGSGFLPSAAAAAVVIRTDVAGTCWVAAARSGSGATFWNEEAEPTPKRYEPGDAAQCAGVDLAGLAGSAGPAVAWTASTSLGAKPGAVAGITPNGASILVGSIDGGWLSTDHAQTWQPVIASWAGVTPGPFLFSPDGGTVATADTSGQIHLSTDGGRTFTAMTTPPGDGLRLLSVQTGGVTVYAGGMVWITPDGGWSWSVVSTPWVPSGFVSGTASTDGSHIVLIGGDGNAYVTADTGASWATHQTGAAATPVSLGASRDLSTLIISDGTAGGLFRSGDGGTTWSKLPAPAVAATTVAVSADGARVIIGGPSGVYTSTNSGSTWRSQPGGPSAPLSISGDGHTIAATTGTSVYVGSY